ncbi:TIGR01777 family oxidoreductase [Mangrovibacterium marinum]|uniref:TIGR01777 family protein n=1 Tax=Mangrovibacterium marinum TaxID=1639118 RepID=A0A2T5C0G0_9BACT|nr:TIGR01777 family oxidoreductase [Mangrovibacterium marinum]PTN08084.1 hypothetical protein C8N47_111124 [Mangrovibacterium marinum]
MKVCITGASGFIGQSLSEALQRRGYQLRAIPRQLLYGDPQKLSQAIAGCDALVNLAGAPILQRWTAKNKATIYSSRVVTSKNLTEAIRQLPASERPQTFISASAVGIYQTGAAPHDETSLLFDSGFTGRVVRDWEQASAPLAPMLRRVVFRIGVVLGKQSQTIKSLKPVFQLGMGGKVGSGKQAFPFIHIHDLVTAFSEAITNPNYCGVYNLVSPQTITNSDFTKAFARATHRPAIFPVPPLALKLLYGEAAQLLLDGCFVQPRRLTAQGFRFKYPTIKESLEEIL